MANLTGNGWVGKCFFDAQPNLAPGGLPQCSSFGFQIRRTKGGAIHGSITVECDKSSGVIKFTARSFSGLTIKGGTASFVASGKVIGVPANPLATANVTLTDNPATNDTFGAIVKAGTKVLCRATNAVKGDVTIG